MGRHRLTKKTPYENTFRLVMSRALQYIVDRDISDTGEIALFEIFTSPNYLAKGAARHKKGLHEDQLTVNMIINKVNNKPASWPEEYWHYYIKNMGSRINESF